MTLREQAFASELDDAFIWLLTVTGDNVTVRATNWSENVVSHGATYFAQPFEGVLDSGGDDAPPKATIKIDNVNLMFMTALRSITGQLRATVGVVTSTDPERYDVGPYTFNCQRGAYDAGAVTLDLTYESLDGPVPYHAFTPALFPGLFR